MDSDRRVFIIIHGQAYPDRLVIPMMTELSQKFKQEFGAASAACKPNALDVPARQLLQALAMDYDDPTKRDKLSQVQAQVQDVKLTMHKNIDTIVQNIDRAKDIEQSSERLQGSANEFASRARDLKNKEMWKKYKTWGCIFASALIFILILLIAWQPWNIGNGGAKTPPPAAAPPAPPTAPSPPPTPASSSG